MNTIRGGFFTFFVVPSVGQTTTSSDGQDVQNAENVRSQAEKRLETQRKDLTRNWGG